MRSGTQATVESSDDKLSVGAASTNERGSSAGDSYSAYPYHTSGDTDMHVDPFYPSPSNSPPAVQVDTISLHPCPHIHLQQVVTSEQAAGFSIIPLTVHSGTVVRQMNSQHQLHLDSARSTTNSGK